MKVYVVHSFLSVDMVTTDRAEAEAAALESVRAEDRTKAEFRPDVATRGWAAPQERLYYVASWSGRWNKSTTIISTLELSTGTPAADPEKDFREHWADRFEAECGNYGRANGAGLIMAVHLMCPERSGWGAAQDTED